jgi:homoserine kinase
LGSSSAAIVAGLLAADAVLHLALPRTRLVEIAAEIEGHPDNVAPALLGGLTVCLSGTSSLKVARLDPHPELRIVLLIPQFPITTESARQVLPACVAYEDAVFNLSRSAATVAALHEGLWPLLGEATRDRLHQPYRLPLMPGVDKVMEAAAEAGAYGVALSGSGPTVAAFCTAGTGRIARAMLRAAKTAGMSATAVVTIPDLHGATVSRVDQ